jgi:hypothetical protein
MCAMSAAIGAFVAQALSHTGSYAHDAGRKSIYLSDEAYRTFGFDPSIGTVTYEQVRSRVHPEDVTKFEACSAEVICQKRGSTSDFRLLLPGTIKHIHCVSRPVFDSSGEVLEVVGICFGLGWGAAIYRNGRLGEYIGGRREEIFDQLHHNRYIRRSS